VLEPGRTDGPLRGVHEKEPEGAYGACASVVEGNRGATKRFGGTPRISYGTFSPDPNPPFPLPLGARFRVLRPRARRSEPPRSPLLAVLSQDLLPALPAYQNVGWGHEENGPHQLTWGARVDWSLLDRVTVIGEASGEGRRDPSFQVLLRTVLLPDRVEMDVSVTRSGPFGTRNTWATVGLTFMSRPLY